MGVLKQPKVGLCLGVLEAPLWKHFGPRKLHKFSKWSFNFGYSPLWAIINYKLHLPYHKGPSTAHLSQNNSFCTPQVMGQVLRDSLTSLCLCSILSPKVLHGAMRTSHRNRISPEQKRQMPRKMLHALWKEQKSNSGTDKKKKQSWIFDIYSASTLIWRMPFRRITFKLIPRIYCSPNYDYAQYQYIPFEFS